MSKVNYNNKICSWVPVCARFLIGSRAGLKNMSMFMSHSFPKPIQLNKCTHSGHIVHVLECMSYLLNIFT